MKKLKAFLEKKDIVFTLQRYGIDALGAMAQGLFCTLLVGTILNTMGQQFGIESLNRAIATIIAAPIGAAASAVGRSIMWATELRPFWMGMLASTVIGIALTLPISSAAICAALTLTGLAGGAAAAGCCAQMAGFAVMRFRENRWGGLVARDLEPVCCRCPTL